ncbi:MAG TPA: Abi family protein [Pseudacidobacterium sp.]|nr:Abi family protein [Pseudacidobacterium sp.]
MVITDVSAAKACLERIGYYRLSGYWYPFRKSHISTNPITNAILFDPVTRKPQIIIEDDFRAGTSFKQVMDLYVFDKRLRLLFLDAIERVEVALRVDIALLLGARDPWAHRNPNQLHGKFTKKTSGHQKWLQRFDESFHKSKEEFVKHFKNKYSGEHLPIWIAIELWDFGMLSVLLDGMRVDDQKILARKYKLPRVGLLTTWMRNINHIRNICAHHSRLWNRSPADQASPPKPGEVPLLDHLATSKHVQIRIYATAAILQFFLQAINPMSNWGKRLKEHVQTFPTGSGIHIDQSGFPQGWDQFALWN